MSKRILAIQRSVKLLSTSALRLVQHRTQGFLSGQGTRSVRACKGEVTCTLMAPRAELSSGRRNKHNKTRRGVRASGTPVELANSGVDLSRLVPAPAHEPPLTSGTLALQRSAVEVPESVTADQEFGKILQGLRFTKREDFFRKLQEKLRDEGVQAAMADWFSTLFEEKRTAFPTWTFAAVLWKKPWAAFTVGADGEVTETPDTPLLRPQDKLEFCRRVKRRAIHKLNRKYFGRRYWKREHLRLYEAWEPQQWGALHAHDLVGNLPDNSKMQGAPYQGQPPRIWSYRDFHVAWREAQLEFGLTPGRVWVLPYEKGRLTDYLCKYVTKDHTADRWSYHHGAAFEGQIREHGDQCPQLHRRPGQSLGRCRNEDTPPHESAPVT